MKCFKITAIAATLICFHAQGMEENEKTNEKLGEFSDKLIISKQSNQSTKDPCYLIKHTGKSSQGIVLELNSRDRKSGYSHFVNSVLIKKDTKISLTIPKKADEVSLFYFITEKDMYVYPEDLTYTKTTTIDIWRKKAKPTSLNVKDVFKFH